jgi:flagellin
MATINTNMSANIAANSMVRNERTMTSTMERLSTGLRINSAKDDAAGLAISSKMTSQIRGLDQAVRNANDAISMIQVAEGAMKEVTNMFQRMRELAVQSISDSNTADDRSALNNEYKQLSAEVARIAENTQWNGTNILDGARTNSVFQIGANADQTISVNFGDLSTNNAETTVVATAPDLGTSNVVGGADAEADIAAFTTIDVSKSTVAKDDVISFKLDNGSFASFKLTEAQATKLNATAAQITADNADVDATPPGTGVAETTAAAAAGTGWQNNGVTYDEASVTMTGTLTGTTAGTVTVAIDQGKIVVTGGTVTEGNKTAEVVVSDVQITRGTHAPIAASDITTRASATSALGILDTGIEGVNSTRATLGASMSRLEYAADNLQNVSQNSSAARSRVLDADYASETTELARTQIIQQASTAMLSQANQAQQSVLSLLK